MVADWSLPGHTIFPQIEHIQHPVFRFLNVPAWPQPLHLAGGSPMGNTAYTRLIRGTKMVDGPRLFDSSLIMRMANRA